MNENNIDSANSDSKPAEGYNQTPYYPDETTSEQVQEPPVAPVTQNAYENPHAGIPSHQEAPVQYPEPSPGYSPYAGYPMMRPRTLADIQEEEIRNNNIFTVISGTIGFFWLTAIFGIFGVPISVAGTAWLMHRSTKIGGGYKLGLTFILAGIGLAAVFLTLMFMFVSLIMFTYEPSTVHMMTEA